MSAPEQPHKPTQPEPILALTIYCMDEQVKMIEKLQEAIEFIKSRTPAEFEGRYDVSGMVIKIVNLQ